MPSKKIKYRSAHHQGSVLVLMLIAIVLTFIIGSSLMRMGEQVKISAFREVKSSHAQAAADSGLLTALQEINNAVEDGVRVRLHADFYLLSDGDARQLALGQGKVREDGVQLFERYIAFHRGRD